MGAAGCSAAWVSTASSAACEVSFDPVPMAFADEARAGHSAQWSATAPRNSRSDCASIGDQLR